MNLQFGLSRAFHNKALKPGYSAAAFGDSFQPVTDTPAALFSHILNGGAFSVGHFQGNTRKNETFISAQLIPVDLDDNVSVADALASPFIRQYAALVYPTPTSCVVTEKNPSGGHRTRILFVLSEPVETVERFRALARGVCEYVGLNADESSYKPAQPYFGSTSRVEQPYSNPGALLPLAVAGALTVDQARGDYRRELARKEYESRPRLPITADYAQRKADSAWGEIDDLAATASGRNDKLLRVARRMFSRAAAGDWPGIDDGRVQQALESIARAWPELHKSLGTIKRGRAYGYAKPWPMPAPRQKPSKPTADIRQYSDEGLQNCVTPAPDALPYELPGAFLLWEAARLAIVCPEYVLIQMHTLEAGIGQGFTAGQLGECMGVSKDKAQRLINAALEYELVGAAADLQGKGGENYLLFNSAARLYRLTPAHGLATLTAVLPTYCLELMEAPNPAKVLRSVAAETGMDDITAGQVETITSAVSLTIEADEVTAAAERRAVDKADEINHLAETDTTPFTPDVLPVTVRELRTALIETYQATNPRKTWLHSEFMWVAGVRKGSVSALIAKSDKIAPAVAPTFKDFQIQGRVSVGAAGKLARREHGAPVAWIDASGEVVGRFSATPPAGATGIKLNCGKTYVPKQAAPVSAPTQEETPVTESKPVDRDELARRRARAAVQPHLRGCLAARGWKHYPGPFGCWERDGSEYPNTWDGIVSALLEDYVWALEQAEREAIAC